VIARPDPSDPADGRKRAEDVLRPGAPAQDRERRNTGTGRKRGAFGTKLAVAAVAILGVNGYLALTSHPNAPDATGSSETEFATPQQRSTTTDRRFQCDGRTHCSQMTSCAEAIYFLQHCPNTQLDGNNDGEPCEQQWCN
jgi:hypothetical protein